MCMCGCVCVCVCVYAYRTVAGQSLNSAGRVSQSSGRKPR